MAVDVWINTFKLLLPESFPISIFEVPPTPCRKNLCVDAVHGLVGLYQNSTVKSLVPKAKAALDEYITLLVVDSDDEGNKIPYDDGAKGETDDCSTFATFVIVKLLELESKNVAFVELFTPSPWISKELYLKYWSVGISRTTILNDLEVVFTPSDADIVNVYVVSEDTVGAVPVINPLEEFNVSHAGKFDEEYTIEVPSGSVARTEVDIESPSYIDPPICPEAVVQLGEEPASSAELKIKYWLSVFKIFTEYGSYATGNCGVIAVIEEDETTVVELAALSILSVPIK